MMIFMAIHTTILFITEIQRAGRAVTIGDGLLVLLLFGIPLWIYSAIADHDSGTMTPDEIKRNLPTLEERALEQAIARAVQDGKDHNETMKKEKERLEQELAKAQAAAARIPVIQSGIAGATAKITEDIKILGPGKLNEIAVALEKVAEGAVAPDERTSEAEREKEEEKEIAFDPLKAICAALDKIDEAILQTIEENTTINA